MRTKRTEREFDCMAHKREVQERIYEEIKDLAPDQEVAYFEGAAQSGPLGEWWLAMQRAHAGRRTGGRIVVP